MNGVTILSEMSVRGEELWTVVACFSVSIGIIVLTIAHNVEYWSCLGWFERIISVIITVAVVTFVILFGAMFCYEYSTFHTEYRVTIDDSVCFNEFTERYEIISSDGDVYTVIDRQVD